MPHFVVSEFASPQSLKDICSATLSELVDVDS
jgi:hypothetical protein